MTNERLLRQLLSRFGDASGAFAGALSPRPFGENIAEEAPPPVDRAGAIVDLRRRFLAAIEDLEEMMGELDALTDADTDRDGAPADAPAENKITEAAEIWRDAAEPDVAGFTKLERTLLALAWKHRDACFSWLWPDKNPPRFLPGALQELVLENPGVTVDTVDLFDAAKLEVWKSMVEHMPPFIERRTGVRLIGGGVPVWGGMKSQRGVLSALSNLGELKGLKDWKGWPAKPQGMPVIQLTPEYIAAHGDQEGEFDE